MAAANLYVMDDIHPWVSLVALYPDQGKTKWERQIVLPNQEEQGIEAYGLVRETCGTICLERFIPTDAIPSTVPLKDRYNDETYPGKWRPMLLDEVLQLREAVSRGQVVRSFSNQKYSLKLIDYYISKLQQ